MRFLAGLLVSLLAACHVNADLETRAPSLNPLHYDTVFYIAEGGWVCSKKQLKFLNKVLDEARSTARSAAAALSVEKSEQSIAYLTWFGQSNATPDMRKSILKNHYQSVSENMVYPTTPTGMKLQDLSFYNTRKQKGNGVTENSLIYSCPPPEDRFCIKYNYNAAVKHNLPSRATLVVLCPHFFEKTSSIESVATSWRVAGRVIQSTKQANAGLTLIHEFQHMAKVTGPENVCHDMPDPSSRQLDPATRRPKACYSPDCCMKLSDSYKIQNAENYGLYAGYIQAWPEKARAIRD
ncbi:hypothetical protein LX32DRAFT_686078 [Colletotrichum zoysiae]|uniref:Lysine-specific metallo-endopeptidase domain-containing protein n=1 Tax=Colletotrichum zoysiae TaxID=1216348 RepID=A0AAD9H7U4_9PEZI|nr:hypothetical protein LX32DRAFT_686078 [Colletotrichum zoysiae]